MAAIRYVGSSEWSAAYERGFLVLADCAGRRHAIENVRREVADELAALWSGSAYRHRLSEEALRVAPRLLDLGAIVREVEPGPPTRVAVTFAGDANENLLAALMAEANTSRSWSLAVGPLAELTLLVRTGGRLTTFPEELDDPESGPHLLLNVALDDTVSLGPLVFPGEPVRLERLADHIGHVATDATSPAPISIHHEARVIGALTARELDKIAMGDYGLVNMTLVLDLRRYHVTRYALSERPWSAAA